MSEARYGKLSDYYADRHGIPRDILRSLINRESGWNPTAVGSAGEVGLGQLKGSTAQDMGLAAGDRANPEKNIAALSRYLKRQYDATGNWRDALCRYNQGPTGAYTKQGKARCAGYVAGVLAGTTEPTAPYTGMDILTDGKSPGGATGMDVLTGKAPLEEVVGQGPSGPCDWKLFDASTWVPAMRCALKGGLAVVVVVALVGYAGFTALKAGG